MSVEVGEQAPDFELKDQHGSPVRLSSFQGTKNVVLVFYPLAFSGVCSGELSTLRDDFPELDREDVEAAHRLSRFHVRTANLGGPGQLRLQPAVRLLAARRCRKALRSI